MYEVLTERKEWIAKVNALWAFYNGHPIHMDAKQLAQYRRINMIAPLLKKVYKDIQDLEACRELGVTDYEAVALERIVYNGLIAFISRWQQLNSPAQQIDGCIMEFRAGVGGEEAWLFAQELAAMYKAYTLQCGWKVREAATDACVTLTIENEKAYAALVYEGGVHRVQRVPVTEARGRVHTSTAAVAVLPLYNDIQIEVKEEDIDFSACRSSGCGGQKINKSNTKVRLVHIPTGIVIECQEERSQLMNRERAMEKLKEQLYTRELNKRIAELDAARVGQVKKAMRSEKARTYNFPDDRITDHRAHVTVHNIDKVMHGDLAQLLKEVKTNIEGV